MKHLTIFILAWALASPVLWAGPTTPRLKTAGPYERQIDRQIEMLQSASAQTRAAAAALGVMRPYRAEDALIRRLDDPAAAVRREAAMALARCGGQNRSARSWRRSMTKTGSPGKRPACR